ALEYLRIRRILISTADWHCNGNRSCAVWLANLYFCFNEKCKLLLRFKDFFARILFYARFVDEVFLIWLKECDLQWKALVLMFNDFGILKWECLKLKTSVDFLDLTLTIEGNRVVAKTYQKPENPYLYIPPHSAHPAGMINGIVLLLLRTYWRQTPSTRTSSASQVSYSEIISYYRNKLFVFKDLSF
ncbi:hypothetical protein ACHAXN_010625, partial [Cyclotella atomus]